MPPPNRRNCIPRQDGATIPPCKCPWSPIDIFSRTYRIWKGIKWKEVKALWWERRMKEFLLINRFLYLCASQNIRLAHVSLKLPKIILTSFSFNFSSAVVTSVAKLCVSTTSMLLLSRSATNRLCACARIKCGNYIKIEYIRNRFIHLKIYRRDVLTFQEKENKIFVQCFFLKL